MSQAIIRSKFLTTISAYAAAKVPAITVSRENTAFTKPADGKTFLEVFIIPADTTLPNVDGARRRFMGNVQISIWTKENCGAGVAEAIAEELSQIFTVWPKNQLPVSIEAPPTMKRAIPDGTGWFLTPLLIQYRMEAEN